MEVKNPSFERNFAQMKNSLKAVGQKTCFETQKGDQYSHSIAEMYRMTPFIAVYLCEQEDLSYPSAIGSPLCIPSSSMKCLDEDGVEALP